MIHPSAVVEDGAQIDETAEIGPFCYISGRAKIGAHNKLIARVTILGDTTLGEGNVIEFQPDAKLVIGSHNVIRENVTMHAGTPKGQNPIAGEPVEKLITRVGSNGMFMVNSHIAHDCVVGDNVIMTNNAVIGGHVRLEDGVILGGNSAVHQFCRIGSLAMVGPTAMIGQDVPPFCMLREMNFITGPNIIGLRRAGFDNEKRLALRHAIKTFFFEGLNTKNAISAIEADPFVKDVPEVRMFCEFIKESKRGIMPGNPKYAGLTDEQREALETRA